MLLARIAPIQGRPFSPPRGASRRGDGLPESVDRQWEIEWQTTRESGNSSKRPSSRTGLPKRSAPILPICCRRSASAWSKFGVLVANWTKCSEGTSGPNTTMAGSPMSDQLRVRDLVEEILESKRSPEEVCADTPQLLSAVCERLAQVRRVGYQLDEMFAVVEPGSRGELPSFDGTIELPIISGYDVEA